jgi:hypothetical protein
MKHSTRSTPFLWLLLQSRQVSIRACLRHRHDNDHQLDHAPHRHLTDDFAFSECGIHVPTTEEQMEAGMALTEWKAQRQNNKMRAVNYQIPVTFHILRATNGDGDLSDAMLDEYINHLNNDFLGSSFSFYNNGINRVNKSAWHFCNADTYFEAAKNLRVGGTADMNVYFCDIQNGAGGWAYFPQARGQYFDGIVVESNYQKYGFPSGYVRRVVLPHEAG